MTLFKTLICLTDSSKHYNHCIAGKEFANDEIGPWIRPISELPTGELTPSHFTMKDGGLLSVLDIIKVPVIKKDIRSTIPYQTENFLVDKGIPWEKIGRFSKADIPNLEDKVDSLWINGYRSGNDRIPIDIASKEISSSLLLIKPEQLMLSVSSNFRKRISAQFLFNNINYRLWVEDLSVKNEYFQKKLGDYEIHDEVFLRISLGEPLRDGYCYKLVASILYT